MNGIMYSRSGNLCLTEFKTNWYKQMVEYSFVEEIDPGRKFTSTPKPLLNYGRYTGYQMPNVNPALQTDEKAIVDNLISIGTPARAAISYIGRGIRPGNNEPMLPGHEFCLPGSSSIICIARYI